MSSPSFPDSFSMKPLSSFLNEGLDSSSPSHSSESDDEELIEKSNKSTATYSEPLVSYYEKLLAEKDKQIQFLRKENAELAQALQKAYKDKNEEFNRRIREGGYVRRVDLIH